jgi:16S rRNA (cytidine1402-2'-O)-methyltransferase
VSGHLFVVGTPIGNLGDLSDRARETLAAADVVAAEDTRRTGKLLAHAGIKARMLSLFEGNERQRIDELLERLAEGAKVALVSDAGMPAVSDPGFRLLRAAVDAGIGISVVPGPSAVTAALVVSGLPTDRWVFEGFLPRRPSERRSRLRALAHDPRTVVLFESPLRVVTLLRDVLVELGDRRAAVARELTKIHEEVLRGRVSEVLAMLLDSEPRGEMVVVVEGAETPEAALSQMVDEAQRLVRDGMRKREAAAAVARRSGGSANEIYRALLDQGVEPAVEPEIQPEIQTD